MNSATSKSSFTYTEGCWNFRPPHTSQVNIQDLVGPDPLGIEPHLMKCDNEFPLKKGTSVLEGENIQLGHIWSQCRASVLN